MTENVSHHPGSLALTPGARKPISYRERYSSTSGASDAFATAQSIRDLGSITYPEGIKNPKELNANVTHGRFRYDREFLIQFRHVCTGRPESLRSLDAIGLEPSRLAYTVPSRLPTIPKEHPSPAATQSASGTGCKEPKRTRTKRGKQPRAQLSGESLPGPVPLRGPSSGAGVLCMDPPKQSWGKFQPLLDQLILSPERFDPISEEIVARVNASECERGDARTLIQAVRAIYETAVAASGQPTAAETCARLCQKMVNRISPAVYEEGVKNTQGKPIAGGQLFRKYLLSHCREEAERCWATKARSAGTDTDRMKQADVRGHGLGLVRFVGELFLLQMITERIIHDGYLKRLLPDTADPTEADVECLCALLTRIGPRLDTPKARKHMGVYFARMAEMAHGVNVSQRMREMLQGVIKLRARGWLTPGGPLGDERTKESGWTPTGALAETSGAAPQAKGGLPLRRPLKAGDLDNFGKPIRKQNT